MISHIATPEYAKERWICPLARTFGDKPLQENCRGDDCPLWRWRPLLTSEPGYKDAVIEAGKLHKDDRNGKTPAEWVNAHRADYGLPAEPYVGWCGLGGKPEA